MDAVHSALEEICCESSTGLHLRSLWPKLSTSLASSGLPVSCPGLRRAVCEKLHEVPGLELKARNGVAWREDLVSCKVGGNMSRSALMGQAGRLPMLSGQAAAAAAAKFNLQNQF